MKLRARLQKAATQVEIFGIPAAGASVTTLTYAFLEQIIGIW